MAIASLAEYKTYASITSTDATRDAALTFLLSAVQKYFERITGRLFDTATFTEYHDGSDSPIIVVKNAPIISVTSISFYSTPTATAVVLDSDTYTFNTDESGIIRITPSAVQRYPGRSWDDDGFEWFGDQPCFVRGFRNYKVIYVGAYGSSPAVAVPDDVKLAVCRIVDNLYEQAGQDPTLNSEKLGDYEYYNGQIADQFKYFDYVLKPYKRMQL